MGSIKSQGNVIYTLLGGRDQLFATGKAPVPFEFNEEVAQVFDDMVTRSVPMYKDVTKAVVEWAREFYTEGSRIYDIGCSTGTTIEAICRDFSINNRSGSFVGIDTSEAMLKRAEIKLKPWLSEHEISLRTENASKTPFSNASLVVMNYTLQFVPVYSRLDLLKSIYSGLNKDGILILADKVKSESPKLNQTQTKFYEKFKERAGYSQTEIERKKEALDNVLVPLTFDKQMEMVRAAGFEHVEPVYKWNNFVTLIAVKS